MENDKKFTKLSALVDSDFTIDKVLGYKFKTWDSVAGKMVVRDEWFDGARKVFQVETDKGLLDLSESQLGQIMVKVQHAGQANVIGTTVGVKSNGKTGIDIRYWLNPLKQAENAPEEENGDEGW